MLLQAVSETLQISPSTFGAGLAADDLILTLYFVTIYSLAKSIPPEQQQQAPGEADKSISNGSSVAADAAGGGGHGGIGGRSISVSCWCTPLGPGNVYVCSPTIVE